MEPIVDTCEHYIDILVVKEIPTHSLTTQFLPEIEPFPHQMRTGVKRNESQPPVLQYAVTLSLKTTDNQLYPTSHNIGSTAKLYCSYHYLQQGDYVFGSVCLLVTTLKKS